MDDESDEVDYAVELLDRLFETADGGRHVDLDSYGASTILGLLMDKKYRVDVMSKLTDFDGMDLD